MEWWQVLVTFVGSGLGVSVPLLIWWLSRRSEARQRKRRIFELLMVEISTNQAIIERALTSVQNVLGKRRTDARKETPEDNFIREEQEIELAPLFSSSFQFLVENDLIRHFPSDVIPDLYEHYARVSRANWLISRVQQFRFRTPILQAIHDALDSAKQTQQRIRNRLEVEKSKLMKE